MQYYSYNEWKKLSIRAKTIVNVADIIGPYEISFNGVQNIHNSLSVMLICINDLSTTK